MAFPLPTIEDRVKIALRYTRVDTCKHVFDVNLDIYRTAIRKLNSLRYRIPYFNTLLQPETEPFVNYSDLVERIEFCNKVLSYFKTNRSKQYKIWNEIKHKFETLLATRSTLDSTIKFFMEQPKITKSVYTELMYRCRLGSELFKKDKKSWNKLKTKIEKTAIACMENEHSLINEQLSEINTLKHRIANSARNIANMRNSNLWLEDLFMEKVESDGSCDNCYYLTTEEGFCKTKKCESGKYILKIKTLT